MKVRNIVRKAAVLGSSAALVGTTLMGALAYDLGTYPAKFIVDGQFDGKIVVGEHAATADVLGSIDIAASLQAASVKKVPVAGATGKSTFEGDSFELSTAADQIELREPIGDVVDTVTEGELSGLKGGRISTSEGDTDYSQYLRFKDGTNLQNMTVNYVENDDNVLSDYLVVDADAPFLEWEVQFPEGLESEVDNVDDGGTDILKDLEDRSFNIMGTDFSIVKGTISGGDNIELTLMGGSVADTLREGETRTYSIGGVDYEVTLVFVSDPNTGSTQAKFSVNGELTQSLNEGDTDTLSGGLQIGVRDVLVNSREGVASFFLGADKVVFADDTTTAESFDGSVEINNDNINDGDVAIQGQNVSNADKFEITSIKYRLTMDAADGTTAYVPMGKGVKEFMKKPESLISDSLDVKYAGLVQVEDKPLDIKGKSDDRYEMTFTNIQGQTYTFPLLSNKDGTLKFGDDQDDFVFAEALNTATYNIGRNDYFAVSNDRGADSDKSVTNVLRYTDYDDDQHTVEFEDQASGNTVNVAIATDGTGSLVIGGHSYLVNVSNISAAEPNLFVDLNGDGGANDVVGFTTWGGVRISFVSANYTDGLPVASFRLVSGNGLNLENGTDAGLGQVVMRETVLEKNFDTANGDETFSWTLSDAANNKVDLDIAEGDFAGPLAGGTTGDAGEFQFRSLESNDDYNQGMTDWGILVKEYDPSGSNDPNELSLVIPKTQRTGQVFVTLGSVTQVAGGGSESEQVNPIAVGLAVLDKDAPAVGSENLIVVGGPCANTVAAALLNNPAQCTEGFEEGKAVIQAWDKGDKVAILVAGYSAQDTQGASKVLAAYKDYSLSGPEVEVVVADLNSISVKPMA